MKILTRFMTGSTIGLLRDRLRALTDRPAGTSRTPGDRTAPVRPYSQERSRSWSSCHSINLLDHLCEPAGPSAATVPSNAGR
ncbi:hypothetical protein [Kitasatospora purpeofusca]|uniref:hypothetical protein n=1 Tax=Kitasatospora purpeofusca TaxID=67352 RepID=UPI0012FEC10A|nr:hypothetical protein [Kitasatospora purpeofusca]